MKRWRLAGKAKRDISEIMRFSTEQWGIQKAEDYLSGLYEKIRLAAEHPAIGVDCSKNLNLGHEIRSILYVSHIIYYTVSETCISVVAVLHQSMVPKKHLQSRFL